MQINIHLLTSSSSFIANNSEIIPQNKLVNNSNIDSSQDLITPSPGAINNIPNHPAERLVNNPDKTLNLDLVSIFFMPFFTFI